MLVVFVVVCLVAAGASAYVLFKPGALASSTSSPTTIASTPSSRETAASASAAAARSTGGPSVGNSPATSSSSAALSGSSTSAAASPSSSSMPDAGDEDQSTLKAQGISTFLGNNTGGIASWYHTDSSKDSTNGRSWCEFPYDDSVPGFAPSLKTMLSSFSGDAEAAKTGFCGQWASVYSPKTGKTTQLMIADAFDDSWVLTPASIDVIYGSFADLFGSSTDDKNDVVKEVSWILTGERDDKFTYKGVGVG
ncbi:hypothetical protein JCM9279_000766 [Rhodotorula babjevae]